jgi:hypothetical protein
MHQFLWGYAFRQFGKTPRGVTTFFTRLSAVSRQHTKTSLIQFRKAMYASPDSLITTVVHEVDTLPCKGQNQKIHVKLVSAFA